MQNIRFILLLGMASALAYCSSAGPPSADPNPRNLALTIEGAKSFNPNIIHGQVQTYRVTVSADDLAVPMVQEFPGNAVSVRFLGIPYGHHRFLKVEALNPNGLIIRRGTKPDLTILPNEFSKAHIVMHSVPIFTNLMDGSAIPNTRLHLEVFGEPGARLQTLSREEPMALLDTGNPQGLFSLTPQGLEEGMHTFIVQDMDSGESSQVNVTLYDSAIRPGLALSSAASLTQTADELIYASLGQGYYRKVDPELGHLGNDTLMDIIDIIY